MTDARAGLFAKLDALGIQTVTVEHEPVFTVAESAHLRESLPGAHTKNLFLADKDGRMALVVARDETRVDLKNLARLLGLGRLSFGKPELLARVLGVEPGSVTPLALVNAGDPALKVVVDASLMAFDEVNCHPLRNDATTRLASQDLLRFIRACGYEPLILELG
jgi:Ala-tRNA(Pro) deacylase